MLSKFLYEREVFSPTTEMSKLLQDLREDIKKSQNSDGTISRDEARVLLDGYLFSLKSLVYGRFYHVLSSSQNPLDLAKKISRDVGFPSCSSNEILFYMRQLASEMIDSYACVHKIIEKSEPFESLWVGLERLIKDHQRFVKDIDYKSKFFESEFNILNLLQGVVTPFLDPYFIKIKNLYVYKLHNNNMKIVLNLDNKFIKKYQNLKKLKETYQENYSKWQEQEKILLNFDVKFCNDVSDEFESIDQQITIYSKFSKLLCSTIKEDNVDDVDTILPVIKQMFICADAARDNQNALRELSCKINNKIKKARKNQSLKLIPDVVKQSSDDVDLNERLQILSLEDKEKASSEEKSTKLLSERGIVEMQATEAFSEESLIKTEGGVSFHETPPLDNALDNCKTTVNTFMISYPKASQKDAKNNASRDEEKDFKGTSKKIVEAIFSGSLKIKYDDLITLVRSLAGTEDKKSGSSSRKLHLPSTSIFLHKRHGRDRAKYVDPNVIKRIKDALIALGVTPENPRSVLKERIKTL